MSEPEIDYESLAQDALRGIVKRVISRVAKHGLPGDHHFYIAFDTNADGVSLSKRLKERYPKEMTIVLQHRFWDLQVHDDRMEVKLTFNNIPERLVVPYKAIKVFFDPSVPYGLQFEASELVAEAARGDSTLSDFAASRGDELGTGQLNQSFAQDVEAAAVGQPAGSEPLASMSELDAIEELVVEERREDDDVGEADTPDEDEPRKSADIVELDAFRKKS